jgi:vacuolar-type H+-ATPase subunit E/Vma4
MPDDQRKLDAFIKEIISDADRERDRIRADYRARMDEAIEEAKLTYCAEAERYFQNEMTRVRAESGRAISKKLMGDKHALFLYRQKLTDELSEDVKKRIDAYTRTPEYMIHLEKLFYTALEQFHFEPVVVYLRPVDLQTTTQIGKALPKDGITLKEGAFTLGGLICECPGRHLMLDLTFDAKFADISARYSELLEYT